MRHYVTNFSLTTLLLALSFTNAMATNEVEQSSVVQAVAPMYPAVALAANASGTVIIEVQVDARGVVTSARTVEGIRLLGKAAESSARRWVFAANDEKSVRVVRLTFTFKLMPDNAAPDELLPIFMPPYHVEVRRTAPEIIDNPNIDPPMSRQPTRKKRP